MEPNGVTALLDHWQALALLGANVFALAGTYWRLIVRMSIVERGVDEVRKTQEDIENTLERIDNHKVDQQQCRLVHDNLAPVLTNIQGDIREIHKIIVELAMLIRRDGTGG